MDCLDIPKMGFGAFSRQMHAKVIQERIPIAGSIELTTRCNLRCQHCYLEGMQAGIPGKKELSVSKIRNIFDQVVDEGTLWMLITGGEPILRRDFKEIYTYAKRKGLLITLFTNGTLITAQIADLLAEWQPVKVEVTLYGLTQAIYERVTGVPGSHARCMAGIELLQERKVPLSLKSVVMTLNRHELAGMQAYAKSLGVGFRYDPMLNASLNGSHQPLALRLPPEEVVQLDVNDAQRMEQWRSFCEQFGDQRIDTRYNYTCDAGRNSYHIDPYGQLVFCMLSRSQAFDLRQGSFKLGWREYLFERRFQPTTVESECNECELLVLCGQCPGWSQLEQGAPRQPVEYLCQVAHLRAMAFDFHGNVPISNKAT